MELREASTDRMEQNRVALEEARQWLSILIDNPDKTVSVSEYKAMLKKAKKAVSDAEAQVRLDEHIAKVVSEWPTPEPWMIRRIVELLYGRGVSSLTVDPERPEVIAIRNAEVELTKVRKSFRDAMAGCHGCGLDRKAHTYQQSYATGYHDFQELSPEGAIKVAQVYKKKIAIAEKALDAARA